MTNVARVPKTTDDYLDALSDEKRAALQRLRRIVRAVVPGAEECISYGVPGFRLRARWLLSFGAASKHCAIYPGAYAVRVLKKELKGYSTSKGTVRFPPERPLPAALVRKLVKARLQDM